MWKHPHIKSWDAVHVACAIKVRRLGQVECFDTFDGDLIALTGKLEGTDLRLSVPDLPPRFPLFAGAHDASVFSSATVPPSEQSPAVEKGKAPPSEPGRPSNLHVAPGLQLPGSSPTVPQPPPSKK